MSELWFTNVYELRWWMNDWLNNWEKTVPYMNNWEDIMMNSNKMMNDIDYKTVTINATSWKFDKPLLKFKKWEKVKIKINNIDKLHWIVVPGMRLQDNNEIIVDTSKTWEFKFQCLNYCGEWHKDMTWEIIIE
jgi:heme/copper-type cytochrome/quinol oxidase subunit 2